MIDLRSDTVTVPTPEMREAMAKALVGDDVYGEDPTVNRLQEISAKLFGKEAALFFPSGTMANQAALLAHTERGDEVVLDSDAHIYYYEAGAMALLSGVQPRLINAAIFGREELEQALRPKNVHFPKTSLVCIENTHNRAGGTVWPIKAIHEIGLASKDHGLKVHMDGARIFNAATALDVSVADISEHVDSVQFCLSKGLAAPAGSMLVGSKEFIQKAYRARKVLGGGMRQAGILAAAGIIAIEKMSKRLAEDHANARLLAEELEETGSLEVNLETVQTNMVMVDVSKTNRTGEQWSKELLAKGIKVNPVGPYVLRFVTHKDVSREDIINTVRAIRESV